MSLDFSYRHLYYFWVVAKEGGLSKAAERLGMAVQTVSTQVRELERSLGFALLKPAGRGVALTDAGVAALRQADQIFQLGEQLPAVLREAVGSPVVRLAVGISDGLGKLAVRQLMQPIIDAEPNLRLLCHEDQFEGLLAELALHRLDVVLSDRPAPTNPNLKVYSHSLGFSNMAWYAPADLYEAAARDFPRSLADVPLLLPTTQAAVRLRLDQWLERQGIRARIVGEFEDSALLATFGSGGFGVFPAAELMQEKLTARYELRKVGVCEGVEEHYFAIGTNKKISHPLVRRLLPDRE